MSSVGVRELRQNLSRYLERVKAGEALDVTERGRLVARLSPADDPADAYAGAAARFGATIPVVRLEDAIARLPAREAPAGTADAILAEGRTDRLALPPRPRTPTHPPSALRQRRDPA